MIGSQPTWPPLHRSSFDRSGVGAVSRPQVLLTIRITFAAGSLPIDLTLIAVGASPDIPQRSLAAIQARPGPVKGLPCVFDQGKRLIGQSAGAVSRYTTPRVDHLLQGVEPALPLVRSLLALVRQLLTLVRATVPIVRETIRPESSVMSGRHLVAVPRLVRSNRIRRSHPPTVRSGFTS